MPYNRKDYRTNRSAVLTLREKLRYETVAIAEAIAMGAKRTQLSKWEKDGKLKSVLFEGKNRYDREILKTLIIESLK